MVYFILRGLVGRQKRKPPPKVCGQKPLFNFIPLYFLVVVVKFNLVFHLFSLFFTFILAQGERKLLATVTRRTGPSVAYANGALQALPDLFKFLTKTVNLSYRVNRLYYNLAACYSLLSGYFL